MGVLTKIKEDATKTRTTIQTEYSVRLEQILNKLFYLDKDIDEEVKFLQQVMTRGLETQERIGLHASSIIKDEKSFCLRQQILSLVYKQLQSEQFAPDIKRIFEEGNAVHEKWQRLFIRGGYCDASGLDVTKYHKDYPVQYTPDIICEIPEFTKGKLVVEIKSVNTYQFGKMGRHPSAGKQLQFYMYLTGIHQGFVLNEDKNLQKFKTEFYRYDPELVAPYIERLERIKHGYNNLQKNHRLVKRPPQAESPVCKFCATCMMRNSCWNLTGGKVRL